MTETTLHATLRTPGTGSSRAARRAGSTPAVVYGHGLDGLPVSVGTGELRRVLSSHASLVKLQVEGQDDPYPTMIKDVQTDPVKGELLHVDFFRVALGEAVRTRVPVALRGQEMVAKAGGILGHYLHEVEVECLPSDIPRAIEVDVTKVHVGQRLTVGDLEVPPGVKVLTGPGDVVLVVDAPKAAEEAAPDTTRAEPAVVESKGKTQSKEE